MAGGVNILEELFPAFAKSNARTAHPPLLALICFHIAQAVLCQCRTEVGGTQTKREERNYFIRSRSAQGSLLVGTASMVWCRPGFAHGRAKKINDYINIVMFFAIRQCALSINRKK